MTALYSVGRLGYSITPNLPTQHTTDMVDRNGLFYKHICDNIHACRDEEVFCAQCKYLLDISMEEDLAEGLGSEPKTILKRTVCYRDLRRNPAYQMGPPILPSSSKRAKRVHHTTRYTSNLDAASILAGLKETLAKQRIGSQEEELESRPPSTAPKMTPECEGLGSLEKCPWDLDSETTSSTSETE